MIVTPTTKQPTEGPQAASIAPGAVVDIPQSAASLEVQTMPHRTQMRPLLISEDSNLARFFKLYETFTVLKPHSNIERNTEPEGGESRQRTYLADDMATLLLAKETPTKRFQVIAFTRGGTQDSFTEIAFGLTQSDMDYLSIWLNKKVSQLKSVRWFLWKD
jgi:negative regulator of replication initiation